MEGLGYCLKEVVVTASYPDSSSSDSDDSWPSDDSWWSDDSEGNDGYNPPAPPTGGGGGPSHGGGSGTSDGTNNPANKPNPYPQTTKTVRDVAFLYALVEGMGGREAVPKCG